MSPLMLTLFSICIGVWSTLYKSLTTKETTELYRCVIKVRDREGESEYIVITSCCKTLKEILVQALVANEVLALHTVLDSCCREVKLDFSTIYEFEVETTVYTEGGCPCNAVKG